MIIKLKAKRQKLKAIGSAAIPLILTFNFLLLPLCFAQATSSSELITRAKEYDGKTVIYAGEVVGDVMLRGQHAWINVHDGENALGVWVKSDAAEKIAYAASYKSKGDWVEVLGVFNRACPEHGGDLDIHAQALKVIKSGRITLERLNPEKRNLAVTLGVILVFVWMLTLFRHR